MISTRRVEDVWQRQLGQAQILDESQQVAEPQQVVGAWYTGDAILGLIKHHPPPASHCV